jgi:hypothetical protein
MLRLLPIPKLFGIQANQVEQNMDREAILKSMLGGVNPALDDTQMKSIASAMKAFTIKQLQKMEEAGVRIWPFVKGLPPEYQMESIPDLGSPAEYIHQFRTIRISPASLEKSAITDFLRHELAHAWDNVRTGKNPKSLRKLKGDALGNELNRRAQESEPFESQSKKKLPPGRKFSMQEMLDRYKQGLPDKTKSFAHPSTAEKHNAKNVMEFYAEGYSVFHGTTQTSQGRMLWLAPELFGYLEQEAKGLGLLTPSRDALKKVLDGNEKGWRSY